MNFLSRILVLDIFLCLTTTGAFADTTLIGLNLPDKSVLDGDFADVHPAPWRSAFQSPHWTTRAVKGNGKVGLASGRMMNDGVPVVVIESPVLDHTPLKKLSEGEVLAWQFASNTEYPCDGRVSLALVFEDQERIVAKRVKVPNGPDEPEVYEGFYTVTDEDAALGMPRVRFTLESTHGIKVYIDWVDLKVISDPSATVQLAANAVDSQLELTWNGDAKLPYSIYRSSDARTGFEKIADGIDGNHWGDTSAISGKTWFYAVKRKSSTSNVAQGRTVDTIAPAAPTMVKATDDDWVTKLSWSKIDPDIAYFKVYRSDDGGKNMVCIAPKVTGTQFVDDLPVKGQANTYAVQAVDFSGNESPLSDTAEATTRAVRGASFSDLILPMPIHKQLRSDVWGGDNVLPRDPDNGVEDPFWSYWGGKVIKDPADGKYHILVVHWPENDRKGHWAWPHSTVAHVVSDNPTGPYRVVKDLAYDHQNGSGHNANIIPLNDGRYALYSLIHFVPKIFTSDTMSGPWKLEGEIEINYDNPLVDHKRENRYRNNLTGIQQPDGSVLIATKSGAMMRSNNGLLGPYEVLNRDVNHNTTIPKHLRSNYEDPAFWYDGVQYHLLINANYTRQAVYFRSPNGIDWKYETGFAFTPTCTVYEDGTRTFWDKVERPNVLQDEFGRATHLSLAVIDSPKEDDYGSDIHSSKHLILPLVVYKRMTMLNDAPVSESTHEIRVVIHSEQGFDPAKDLNLPSLRFGASEAVNFGGGSKLIRSAPHDDGLLLVFEGAGNGMTQKNFVCKLIGRDQSGGLIVGYSKTHRDSRDHR
ncbi:putative secreted protein [Rhodopirellula sallentina]|uniref:Putative secreted protein n=1 Tax=Rhodopirellula sallentina SM41 TaxID=1263870 RepID=M5TU67_9BACT|nr:putative secreted protein [Rhodopirellula sallentina]EMI52695.1 putative secreted protein [Rhodopirellula sallentina SM41]